MPEVVSPRSRAVKRTGRIFIIIPIVWTALIAGLFSIYYYYEGKSALSWAKSAAVHSLRKDFLYREWASVHGGVYVPITEHTQPNPYLSDVSDRDIETTSGKKLTLINPAYMNRQVFNLGVEEYGLRGHITSLNPIRPENAPDDWERKALKSLEDGRKEFSGLATVDGVESFRYMVALKVESSCLRCHVHQGYKVGEIRGGIGVSLPWKEFHSNFINEARIVAGMYGTVWFIGLIGCFWAKRTIASQVNKQEDTLNELAKSERLLSTVLQATSVGIGLVKDRVIQWTNGAMTPMTGYSADELCGHESRKFYISDQEYERAGAVAYKEIAAKSMSTLETRFRRKDGSPLEVLMNLSAVDKTDLSAGAVFTIMDITESKKMAKQFEENVLRMERAEIAARFGNWELDLNSRKVKGSKGAFNIYGLQQDEMDLEAVKKFPLPEYRAKLDAALSALIGHQERYNVEYKAVRPSDNTIVDIHSIADFNPEANVIWGVIQDITEQKQGEEALRQSEAKYRMLTENMRDIIWSADHTTKFTYISPSVRNVLGFEPEEMLEKTYFDLLTPEVRERFKPVYSKRISSIQELGPLSSKTYEIEIVKKDNSRIWVEVVSNPKIDTEGRLVGFQGVTRDVSQRKQQQEDLAASELLYRTLFESARESIIIIDLEGDGLGRIVSANPAAAKIHGYSMDEFTTLSLKDLETPDSSNALQKRIDTVLSGQLLRGVLDHRRKDGSVFPIEISANLIEIRGHRYCIGIDRDISERKLAEDALSKSESKFRSYVEASPVGIFETDSDGRMLSANKACSSITGFSNQALMQMRLLDLVQPESMSDNLLRFQKLKKHGEEHADVEIITASGDTIWESVHAVKLSDDRFLFFIVDITDRKRAEEQLKIASEETLQLIGRMTNGFIIFESVFDEDGKFVSYRHLSTNDAFEKIIGVKSEDVIGKTIHEAWPGTEQGWVDRCGEVAMTGVPQSFEMYHGPTDKVYYCSVYRPWESADRFCMILEDITQKKRAQEELLEMERKLLQSQKLESLGVLSGGIAHDFNNLLAVIIGNIELAQESDFSSSENKLFLERALSASMRSAGLIRQMLDYSGKGAFELNEVNLSELVENNIDMFRMTVPKNINLNVDSSDDEIFVKADMSQIQQVIMNLLINASESFEGRNGTIRITTGAQYCDESLISKSLLPEKPQPQNMAFVSVRDEGMGMDAQTVGRIFDPFFSTKFVGRGLGMSVVHGVVRGHHGAVTIDSQPGSGTTITVLLPLLYRKEHVNGISQATKTVYASEEENSTEIKTFSVLVVDDEPEVLELLVKQLRGLGCKTFSAINGKEAIDIFKQNRGIDLVILDFVMPEMGGLEAFHKLTELDPELNIVLCSGYKEEHFRDDFKTGLKPVAFLDKPYRFSTVKSLIQRLKNQPI